MKKLIVMSLALCLVLMPLAVLAEDYSAMSPEDLQALRDEKLVELTRINTALGGMVKESELYGEDSASLGKIKDLFPDEVLAVYIRDKLGKFSIEQPVTQAELDTIETIMIDEDYGVIVGDLTGIGHLRQLKKLYLSTGWSFKIGYGGSQLPEEFYTLYNLEELDLNDALDYDKSNIDYISPEIGNLNKLRVLRLDSARITSLPDTICNLTNLEELSLNDTRLTSLPENIGNLTNLYRLNISNTAIESLPDSIWLLSIEYLNMSGTAIK